jgi:hypothetical protein
MHEPDDLDRLIDAVLASYAEPRAGLEQRVLARISGEGVRSSRRKWVFAALAAPAAAALILLGYLVAKTPYSQPGQMAHTPAMPSAAPVVTAPARPAARKAAAPGHIRHIHRVDQIADRASNDVISRPKLDVFPTPQPLNAGEQALIRFVSQAPEADRQAIVEDQKRIDEPLRISAIRIPPLQLSEENQK